MAPIVDITSRRVALSRLLALSISVPLAPQRAPALEAATSDVRKLASVRDKASELLGALPKLAEEDSPMCEPPCSPARALLSVFRGAHAKLLVRKMLGARPLIASGTSRNSHPST